MAQFGSANNTPWGRPPGVQQINPQTFPGQFSAMNGYAGPPQNIPFAPQGFVGTSSSQQMNVPQYTPSNGQHQNLGAPRHPADFGQQQSKLQQLNARGTSTANPNAMMAPMLGKPLAANIPSMGSTVRQPVPNPGSYMFGNQAHYPTSAPPYVNPPMPTSQPQYQPSSPQMPPMPQMPPQPPQYPQQQQQQTGFNYQNNSQNQQYPPQPMQQQQQQQQQQQHFDRRATNLLQERNILPPYPLEPPKIKLPHIFEHPDVNCSPDLFRCTVTSIPQTQDLLKKARLPLGLIIHPFKDMKQLSVLQSSIIVRCRSCRTYINPFVSFTDQRHWKCNVCGRVNDLPEEFHFDPATKTYGEPSRRPEIKNATVEFIAPSEYMVRPPQPSAYLFILDVTMTAVETGYLDEFCAHLIENIDHIPGDHRTLIGFMAVDSQIHYFLLRDGFTPKELIVNDIEDSFLPWNQDLLVNFSEKKETVKQFLEQLPSIYAHNKDNNCALGAALTAAHSILSDIGGRITVFQASLANLGPGELVSREDPNLRAAKEITNLVPASDFYKKLSLEACAHQVAMDLFLLSTCYADIATLSEMSKFCGGCVNYYPGLHAIRNPWELERFGGDLDRYFTRKVGWESVLRIRCSKGLSLHTFHGNFFVRSTDLLALANVNPDAAFGVQVQMDENLHDHNTVSFQAALLYTSSRGERRIRVHTLCLPVTTSLADIQQGADVQTIVSMLAKMAVDRSVNGSISDAREALVNSCVDALGSYAASFAASQRVGALLAPEGLKLFPLYILGLLKHPAFAYGTSIKLDNRVCAMNSFKTLPNYFLMLQIYPDLYPLHVLDDQTEQLPLLQLSYEKIDRHGAYLMDTGIYLYLYVGQAISDTFCRNVFDVATFTQIDEDMGKLPEMNNQQSELIRKFIEHVRSKRPLYSPLRIIREDSPNKELFVQRLVDDRSDSTFSYVEFLQHLHKELSPR